MGESVCPDNSLITADEISQYNPADSKSNLQKIDSFVRQLIEVSFGFTLFVAAPSIIYNKIPIDFQDTELIVKC